ncbi:MAG: hypothetical protein FWD69_18685 [Polyangiaceae bacterium]|nr:hypothetical protein [Polyangiaceae bacterium]
MTIRGWNDAWQPLFESLGRMQASWPTRGWSWDSRLMCCTSSFSSEQEPAARAAAALALKHQWTQTTLARAPQALRDAVEHAGGVRAGQLILSSGLVSGLLAYGLWWPWGDAETVSLRVGLADVDPNKEPFIRFRDLFGVTY